MAKTILLADDSVTIQKVVELTFMDEDFEVEAVGSGNEAIEWLQGAKPDLVIADVHMPGADGYAVCEHAKSRYADLPVLLLVGTFEPFDEGRASAAGADAHLKKPFDAQDLLGHVSRLTAVDDDDDAEDATIASYRVPASDPSPFQLDTAADPPTPPQPPAPAPTPAVDHATRVFQAHGTASQEAPKPPGVPLETVAISTIAPEDVPPAPSAAPAFAEAANAAPETATTNERAEEFEDREVTEEIDPETVAAAVAQAAEQAGVYATPRDASAAEDTPAEDTPAEDTPANVSAADSAPADAGTSEDSTSEDSASVAVHHNGNGSLSDDDVERIARRVVELAGASAVRDVAWEVVPDLAEVVIKERIRDLESQLE